jgi:AcrR family transcriptional regulator
MADPVKHRRSYSSIRRRAQARELREDIIDAARRLFLAQGYVGTTMDAIAGAAGVARPTVFAAFGTKAAILSQVIDRAIGGEELLNPVTGRPWYRQLTDEPGAARALRAHARYCCGVNARVGPVQRMVEAAAGDPKVAALLQDIKDQRLRGMRAVGELLAARGALRTGLGAEEAGDVIWGLTDARLYESFVEERAWTADRYARWLGDALCALLLPS